MLYQWLKFEDMTCEELTRILGIKVKSIARGAIILNESSIDPGLEPRNGIQVEFETQPTEAQLIKLDSMLAASRIGGLQ